jgi:hypothetical protein
MTQDIGDIDEGVTPTFHPIWQRTPGAWLPGDNAASLLVAGQHTWEDIERLFVIRGRGEDAYDRKLLLKYIVVELRSMVQVMNDLQAKVMTAAVYTGGERPLYRGISKTEREAARELWAAYSKARKAVESDILALRNKIGAHRDTTDWNVVMSLWDKLDTVLIEGLMKTIPPAFNHAKELNIFEWNRGPRPGVVEILGAPIDPSDWR